MSERLAQFKEKRPEGARRWDVILSPLLGMRVTQLTEGSLARRAMDDVQSRLLAAQFGEPEPTVPTSSVEIP